MEDYGKIMGVLRPSLTKKITDFFESNIKIIYPATILNN